MAALRRLALVTTLAALAAGASAADQLDAPKDGTSLAGSGADAHDPISMRLGGSDAPSLQTALKTIRWGAYGEVHYNNFQSEHGRDMLEVHRLVLLSEAQLAEWIRFVAEIEYEHGFIQGGTTGTPAGTGEIVVEQMYLDFTALRWAGTTHHVRAGTILVPISMLNLEHEPTLFHGVERPVLEQIIIPTTWHENGAGLFGDIGWGLDYAATVTTTLNGANVGTGSGTLSSPIRNARQKGNRNRAEDWLFTGRLDWRTPFVRGLRLAAAATGGDISQETATSGSATPALQRSFILYTGEVAWQDFGFDVRGTVAEGRFHGRDSTAQPEVFNGQSATLAYDLFRHTLDTKQELWLFGRYEHWDTQFEVSPGVTANPASNGDVYQFGLSWKPVREVVIKADYQDFRGVAMEDVWNLGLGFAF